MLKGAVKEALEEVFNEESLSLWFKGAFTVILTVEQAEKKTRELVEYLHRRIDQI